MNSGRKRNVSAFDKKIAQPTRNKKKPRYIGLRLTLYMPDNTKDDDDSGFIGLNVVLARLNESTPDMTLIAPAIAKLTASDSRAGNTKSNAGTVHETSHISAADTRTTTTGGTFKSRPCMATAP